VAEGGAQDDDVAPAVDVVDELLELPLELGLDVLLELDGGEGVLVLALAERNPY